MSKAKEWLISRYPKMETYYETGGNDALIEKLEAYADTRLAELQEKVEGLRSKDPSYNDGLNAALNLIQQMRRLQP